MTRRGELQHGRNVLSVHHVPRAAGAKKVLLLELFRTQVGEFRQPVTRRSPCVLRRHGILFLNAIQRLLREVRVNKRVIIE